MCATGLFLYSVLTLPDVVLAEGTSSAQSASFHSFSAIPDSTVTEADGAGIAKARLSCATERYAHGVLGDAIEAGCLIVESDVGDVYRLELPEHQVFEDLVPRIADIDDDGRNDVVLVRSDARLGAALSVYTLTNVSTEPKIQELVSTPAIGISNRWLAPIGTSDFNNDGLLDIAYVQTPHIGGILKVWSIIDGEFQQIAESRGYSNHRIGDTRVSTAAIADFNDDGVMDIALPGQRRRHTVWITLYPEFSVLDTQPYVVADFD